MASFQTVIFHRLRPGRFLLCWAGAFVSLQIMFLLASLAWMVSSYETAFLSFGLLTAPFLTLLAGWIYFRPGFALAFSDRLHLILVHHFLVDEAYRERSD